MTEKTITDLDDLRANLQKIRKLGYAYSRGEWILEAAGVAGPVFDSRGQITAALTISGPAQRFTSERVLEMAHLVKEGAAEISTELGYYPNIKR